MCAAQVQPLRVRVSALIGRSEFFGFIFFFSSRRRHTRCSRDWSSDVCSSDLNGLTTPDVLYWPQSGKIVFFAVLGGFRNFAGPIAGAVIFNYLEVYAVALTQYWQITLGVILIVLVTFLPAGIVGTAARVWRK